MLKNCNIEYLLNEVETMIRMGAYAIKINENGTLSGFDRSNEILATGNYIHELYLIPTLVRVVRLDPESYSAYLVTDEGPLYDPVFSLDCIRLKCLLKSVDGSPLTNNVLQNLQWKIEENIPRIRGAFKLSILNNKINFNCYSRDAQNLVAAAFNLLNETASC